MLSSRVVAYQIAGVTIAGVTAVLPARNEERTGLLQVQIEDATALHALQPKTGV